MYEPRRASHEAAEVMSGDSETLGNSRKRVEGGQHVDGGLDAVVAMKISTMQAAGSVRMFSRKLGDIPWS